MKQQELFFRYLMPIVVGAIIFMNSYILHAFNEMEFAWTFFWGFNIVVLFLFEINRLVINFLDRKNPNAKSLGSRFLLPFLVSYLLVTVMALAIYIPLKNQEIQQGADDVIGWYHIGLILSQVFFVNAIASAFHQLRNFRNHWQTAAIKAENLEKENTKAQLALLKNQISPHFLFNNFNTLNGLIQEDSVAAGRFLEQLSTIYRKVLTYRTEEVIPLQAELETLDAYINMLETRFGENLQIERLTYQENAFYIPPFTLQLLLENAVKHNGFDKKHPLQITVEQTGDWIIMKNTCRPIESRARSYGLGLENIKKRYALLSDLTIVIIQTKEFFQVKIPLLKLEKEE